LSTGVPATCQNFPDLHNPKYKMVEDDPSAEGEGPAESTPEGGNSTAEGTPESEVRRGREESWMGLGRGGGAVEKETWNEL
jgi:hypothetical protein